MAASVGLATHRTPQRSPALVARTLGRPVLFRQRRPGLHGGPFTLIKFRTMRDPDPEAGVINDADKLTPFGSTLRMASLDELPTLWNVLRVRREPDRPRRLMMAVSGEVHAATGTASRGAARRHRACSGVRPQRTDLGAEVRGRH